MLPRINKDDIAVLELDSWQLQGFGDEKISPDIAVFTTFYADHLDYYCGTPCLPEALPAALDAYLADKANIFLNQKPGGALIIGKQAEPLVKEKYAWHLPAHTIIADPAVLPVDWKISLPGEHNRANIACAVEAARAAGIPDAIIREAVESFRGVPGRLERLRDWRGIPIYNYTTATTPEATIAALNALGKGNDKNIVLIMGGSDKALAMDALLEQLPVSCKKVLLLAGTGTDTVITKVREVFPGAALCHSLKDALAEATASASAGDTILFSPAFASFGMFQNEFDRGAQFNELVSKL
jgi:UDP-N-acetylmuramoylalanine--D-glutamate ligase